MRPHQSFVELSGGLPSGIDTRLGSAFMWGSETFPRPSRTGGMLIRPDRDTVDSIVGMAGGAGRGTKQTAPGGNIIIMFCMACATNAGIGGEGMTQIAVIRGLWHGAAPDRGLSLEVTIDIRAGHEDRLRSLIEEDRFVVASRTTNRRVVIELARHLDFAVIMFQGVSGIIMALGAGDVACAGMRLMIPLKRPGLPVTNR